MIAWAAGNPIQWISGRLRAVIKRMMFGAEVLEGLARVGHATRGLVYVLLGVLAMAAALSEARPPSLGGAFSIIDKLPGGWFLLLAIALGLCAYAGWRLMQALLDLRGCGWHAKGLVRRAGMLVEVVLFAGFGLLAAVIALDRSTRIRQEVEEEMTLAVIWTARVLDWPLGHWIIAGVGVGALAMGFNQLAKARRTAFEDIGASEHAMMVTRLVGRIGFAAKGVIFGATGVLFLIAAWRVEASAAGGMRAALTALAVVPLGDWVLLAVSAGLALYGVFGLIKAWCHKPVTL
jgi:hypothetical protein